ncbi:MAG: hypothetical protein R3F11_17360 [Verrucomicrobiales bacterium]
MDQAAWLAKRQRQRVPPTAVEEGAIERGSRGHSGKADRGALFVLRLLSREAEPLNGRAFQAKIRRPFRPSCRIAPETFSIAATVARARSERDFDEALLKPDVDGYDFARYFIRDFRRGEIKPNP